MSFRQLNRQCFVWAPTLSLALALGAACKSSAPEPEPEQSRPSSQPVVQARGGEEASAETDRKRLQQAMAKRQSEALKEDRFGRTAHSGSQANSAGAGDGDPVKGKFTLEDATKGLPKDGQLVAEIKTDEGTLQCELYEDKAPITVANFVGLARGLRPFKDPTTGQWVKRPAYDGTVFHRIIKGFMIQGGDPAGTGRGEPGYVIPDEIWEGAKHDQRGLLCMANRGPNTNGMQFFIMDGAKSHLDGGYTIFGKCGPDSVIEKLASSETVGDRAVNPPKMNVTVKRVPAK